MSITSKPPASKPTIASAGDIIADIIIPLEKLPETGKQVYLDDVTISGGGCAANFAYACSRLGQDSSLYGAVGDDALGQELLEKLERGGVDISNSMQLPEEKTAITFSLIQGQERSFLTFRGTNREYSPTLEMFEKMEVSHVHFPSFFILEGMQNSYPDYFSRLKARRIRTSFDTGWAARGAGERELEIIRNILSQGPIFFPNLDEAGFILDDGTDTLSPEDAADRLLKLGCEMVVVKLGGEGCFVATGEEAFHSPGFSVDVVDTTGAGDCFAACFSSALLWGRDAREAARFANAAAALSVTGKGWENYPTRGEVEEFLKGR